MLLHPVEWHAKVVKTEETQPLQSIPEITVTSPKGENNSEKRSATRNRGKKRTGLNNSSNELYFTTSSLALSHMTLSTVSIKEQNNLSKSDKKNGKNINDENSSNGILGKIKGSASRIIDYLKVLRFYRAIIIAISLSSLGAGFANFLMMIPFVLQSNGFSLEESAYCVSLASCCNMIFRGTIPWASDFPKFNKRFCFMLGVLLLSIATFGKFIFDFFIFFIQNWRPSRYSETIQ